MPSGPERTLTAQVDAALASGSASVPLLLLAARAGQGEVRPEDRLMVLGRSLELGRTSGAGPAVLPGAWALEDPMASSKHARLVRGDEGFTLEDLGSKNGTFVNGTRLTGAAALVDGDLVQLGGHFFVFRMATQEQLDAVRAELALPLCPVATVSPRLALQSARLRKLAASDAEVLLVGETGVGKEIYARALHASSGRKGRFVALNCAAIPRELMESELFGFRAGAHSTASGAKPGLVEEAEGGTLFLDEIGDMARDAQTKLLRFLQDRTLTPLGGTRARTLDVRVVAATNRHVMPGATDGLRDDLLGRLGAAPLWLPPLRERREDLGALIAHFLAQERKKRGGAPRGVEARALAALAGAYLPLNVRQLEKIVTAAVALAQGQALIDRVHLPDSLPSAPPAPLPSERPLGEPRVGRKPPQPPPEPRDVARLLAQHQGNVAEVARALGRQRAAVWRWIKQFGLDPEDHR